jgi:hypothetical protein
MNGPDDSEKDENVGYGRPPIAPRFQKGQTGNPTGRPKDRKSIGTIIRDELLRKIQVREGNHVRSMTTIEAVFKVNLNKALKGDHRAYAEVMGVATKLGIFELPPNEQNISYNHAAAAASAIEIIERSVERIRLANIECVNENDAAPGNKPEPEKS